LQLLEFVCRDDFGFDTDCLEVFDIPGQQFDVARNLW